MIVREIRDDDGTEAASVEALRLAKSGNLAGLSVFVVSLVETRNIVRRARESAEQSLAAERAKVAELEGFLNGHSWRIRDALKIAGATMDPFDAASLRNTDEALVELLTLPKGTKET